jgi:hypothetical protein
MKTFIHTKRTKLVRAIALVLTLSVGAMGVWLLLSGQTGTAEYECCGEVISPPGVLGSSAIVGCCDGYTGTIGFVMIVIFVVLNVILLFSAYRGKLHPVQINQCPNCSRSVEYEWLSCPYCSIDLRK